MARNKENKDKIKDLGFEESIEQLTDIVSKIERGEIELQESLEQYERGMRLIKHCREILEQAEQRIEKISEEKVPQQQADADN